MIILIDTPLVLIEWEDSSFLGTGWRDVTEPLADAPMSLCSSVGWLVLDGEHIKVIVPHTHRQANAKEVTQGGGVMQIPTRCVTKITNLIPREHAR